MRRSSRTSLISGLFLLSLMRSIVADDDMLNDAGCCQRGSKGLRLVGNAGIHNNEQGTMDNGAVCRGYNNKQQQ
jgi:hypothetical protein